MRRRDFIAGIAGAASWPLAARAQQPERVKLVGILGGTAETDPDTKRRHAAFREGLNALDWIEGKNVRIEARWGGGNPDHIRTLGRELVQMNPDVILTNGTPSTAAIKRETSSIPVVFAVITDPIGDGFVASLSRPGGNITGFTAFDSEIGGKWVEMLKEVSPALTRAGLLFNPRLVSYGVDTTDLNRRAASYVDRILKGARPADLPVQTPTKFELVINLKTAKAMGLSVPLSLQSRADEVIE